MCDNTTNIPISPNLHFSISTLHISVDFLEALRDKFFDDPLANCSIETPVDWYEYRKIQYKAFMAYIKRIFTEEFLDLRSNTFYYNIIYDKLHENYNKYIRFFKDRGFFDKNDN